MSQVWFFFFFFSVFVSVFLSRKVRVSLPKSLYLSTLRLVRCFTTVFVLPVSPSEGCVMSVVFYLCLISFVKSKRSTRSFSNKFKVKQNRNFTKPPGIKYKQLKFSFGCKKKSPKKKGKRLWGGRSVFDTRISISPSTRTVRIRFLSVVVSLCSGTTKTGFSM